MPATQVGCTIITAAIPPWSTVSCGATRAVKSATLTGSTSTVSYAIVQGGYSGGDHILNADPLFVSPASFELAPTSAGNYRLRYGSPAIDAGDLDAIAEDEDLDGNPRKVRGVDMGAYEHQVTGTGGVIYVDRDATSGSNNGLDWDNAFTDLQVALSNALDAQVWVAEGGTRPRPDASDRTVAFLLKNTVEVYGGFAGTEITRTQRNWQEHPTVLSGDLDGNDTTDAHGVLTSTAGIVGTNAYHVVVGSAVTQTVVLDGFFITGGHADFKP